ncbi:hypothetical protein GCM10020218_103090 [Dactylosporangium vinaceum]
MVGLPQCPARAQHRRSIAAPYLRADHIEEALVYPVTTEDTADYRGVIEEHYDAWAARLAAHLDAGRDVVVLCEGDPMFYGSYMHMHKRLRQRYPTEVVPGVTSVAGASAVLGRPLVERDEVLTVLPGTLPAGVLAERLAATDSAAVMKLGRTFGKVRDAIERAGRLDEAWYVERATTAGERVAPLRDVDADSVPYFSIAILPSRVHDETAAQLAAAPPAVREGEVVVVGLGPAGARLAHPRGAGRARGGRRPRGLRAVPRPGARQSAPAPARLRQPGRGRAGRVRARPGPRGPAGSGRLIGRPGRVRDGRGPSSRSPQSRAGRTSRCGCCRA